MERTELEELAERIQYRYGTGKHYEIVKAERVENGGWVLTIQPIIEKSEGEKNESDK